MKRHQSQRGEGERLLGLMLAALAVTLVPQVNGACAFLVSPTQCATDDDCTRFNAVCDTQQAICVERSDEAGVGPEDPGSSSTDDSGPPPNVDPKCLASPKPTGEATMGLPPGPDGGTQVAGTLTLGCDKDWTLEGPLVVGPSTTLTIAAGTTIKAKKGTGAAIVVLRGGKIEAKGQKNAPIVFTVDDPAPKANDWRGVFVLGKAPRTGANPYNDDALLAHGGNDPGDSSGALEFVRIEFAHDGIVLGSVGTGTKIDSIQVRDSGDNCFVFNGGTVDAKHLVCQRAVDEQFELQLGYKGKLQFLFGQKITTAGTEHHGILIDGADTLPTIFNATLCGEQNGQGLGSGLTFRNGAKFTANNLVLSGWSSAIDAQSGNLGNTLVLRSSIAFGNTSNPAPAEVEGGNGPTGNDDQGFDELAFFRDGGNADTDPALVDCHASAAPKPWPKTSLTTNAATPPGGFFDTAATFIGAFKDESDNWMTGWTKFQ